MFKNESSVTSTSNVDHVVRMILKFVEEYTYCGIYNCAFLRLWLGLMGNFNFESVTLLELLGEHSILKELYTRGIINFSPPRLSLQQTFLEIDRINPSDRIVHLELLGGHKAAYLITTPPTTLGSFYTGLTVDDSDKSTIYDSRLIVQTPDTPQAHHHMQPIRVLIINVDGVLNPDFRRVFAELSYKHNPHFALITETRLGRVEGREERLSLNMPVSSSVDPVGCFGGMWLLWNPDILTCHIIHRTTFSISAELNIRI
ncbi:hypothetical protein COLO4_06920 [Corchorus olitorius]|uniref:Endonuclease/exonuclease/phosphatase n=1 Tax=Corchorus olitorius TaxID=93759 RepID=A0A1R3KLH8_9ROSI|nr:hypothetical protein COLO4_06920 [Corchorus olitorius]